MKKRFIAVVSVLLALVMSLALTACGDDGRDHTEKAKPSIAISKFLSSDGFLGNLSAVTSTDLSVDQEIVATVERRGSKLRFETSGDEISDETIVDMGSGYIYTKTAQGYLFSQKFHANMPEYVKFILDKELQDVNADALDEAFVIDKKQKTATLNIDMAEKVNALLAPLASAYKRDYNYLQLINDYLKLFSPDPSFPLSVERILEMFTLLVKTNGNKTVGALIQQINDMGYDVYGIIEESGLSKLLGITFDEQTKAVIARRKVGEVAVGLCDFVEKAMPEFPMNPSANVAAATDDNAQGDATVGGGMVKQIFDAMFVTPVDISGLEEKLGVMKSSVLAALSYLRVKPYIDKLANGQTLDLYAMIVNGVQFEDLYVRFELTLDSKNNIVTVKGEGLLKHTYDGDATDLTFLADNNYYNMFDLEITEYFQNPAPFEIKFAPQATLSNVVKTIVHGTPNADVSVYYETGAQTVEFEFADLGVSFDAATSSFIVSKEYLASAMSAETFDGTVKIVADVKDKDMSVYVVLQVMPEDVHGLLAFIKKI